MLSCVFIEDFGRISKHFLRHWKVWKVTSLTPPPPPPPSLTKIFSLDWDFVQGYVCCAPHPLGGHYRMTRYYVICLLLVSKLT